MVSGKAVCRHCGRDVELAPAETAASTPGRTVGADGLAVCGTCAQLDGPAFAQHHSPKPRTGRRRSLKSMALA